MPSKPLKAIKPMFQKDKWRVLRGDLVQITAGKDRGLTGRVLRVIRDTRFPRVIVEGRNMVKKHVRQEGAPGFVVSMEAPLHYSNVMVLDPVTSKPVRTRWVFDVEAGQKLRLTRGKGASRSVLYPPAPHKAHPGPDTPGRRFGGRGRGGALGGGLGIKDTAPDEAQRATLQSRWKDFSPAVGRLHVSAAALGLPQPQARRRLCSCSTGGGAGGAGTAGAAAALPLGFAAAALLARRGGGVAAAAAAPGGVRPWWAPARGLAAWAAAVRGVGGGSCSGCCAEGPAIGAAGATQCGSGGSSAGPEGAAAGCTAAATAAAAAAAAAVEGGGAVCRAAAGQQAPLHHSNVMVLDPVTSKPVRTRWVFDVEAGQKLRLTRGKGASRSVLYPPAPHKAHPGPDTPGRRFGGRGRGGALGGGLGIKDTAPDEAQRATLQSRWKDFSPAVGRLHVSAAALGLPQAQARRRLCSCGAGGGAEGAVAALPLGFAAAALLAQRGGGVAAAAAAPGGMRPWWAPARGLAAWAAAVGSGGSAGSGSYSGCCAEGPAIGAAGAGCGAQCGSGGSGAGPEGAAAGCTAAATAAAAAVEGGGALGSARSPYAIRIALEPPAARPASLSPSSRLRAHNPARPSTMVAAAAGGQLLDGVAGIGGAGAAEVEHEPAAWPPLPEPQARVAASAGIAQEVLVSGVSVSIANTVTNPLDMIKTRMQLQPVGQRVGMFKTGAMVVTGEGVLSLWKGLTPSLMRGMFFGGLRLGMYTPAKQWLVERERAANPGAPPVGVSMTTKVLAGTLSGTGAALVCSPTELLKTRMQAAAAGHSTMDVVRDVVRRDGFLGLYRGATPGVVRSSVLTATQCATYDEVKRWIVANTGLGDGLGTQLVTGLATGLVSTAITNPVDVIKTNMFTSGSKSGGPVATAREVYRRAGLRGFGRGFSASYTRLGPQTLCMFLAAEQLRKLTGMDSL
ncbi:mitochondrial carrier protein [Raphidocelis subcapitata]|uniref:Mitochondrial carrier protein n=1 Tax=Raphidocelis subcapitata TaxID=307507 RepID=A0A2V0NXX0_9CHLO|nr:mitochondrial carrier protein [Raphidocelis subcapitata]|eukprot:GBF92466.1 mitochondrial carrier protein [Raphidocelis subcapitata]